MPKLLPSNELQAILEIVAQNPGISLAGIISALEIPISRRKIQHRLGFLIKKKHLIADGIGRGRRYKPILDNTKINSTGLENLIDYGIPLSKKAKETLTIVQQPIQARTPVGYNRQFLDDYRPNETYYLSKSLRLHLLEIGKTDGERPAGTYAREVLSRLLIDLSWNSSRLEGNTYSLLETERLIEFSDFAESKDLKEAQMILNHKEAIEFLVDSAEEIGINSYTILNLHGLLSQNLLADPGTCGRVRERPVGISKTVYHPLSVPQLIKECFQQVLDTANAIKDPLEQAFFLMVHLPYLQPFEDVNKRVSRLAANIPLIRWNLCPLSFVDVPQDIYVSGLLAVYELNNIELLKDVFVWSYERSSALYSATRKALGEPDPFRMRYRNLISETIISIVRERKDIKAAVEAIKQKASECVILNDRLKFIETVENELRGLHEGNIARYRIRPSEYIEWYKFWRQS